MTVTQVTPYSALPTSVVRAANGISYAYRDTGGREGTVPLVLLQQTALLLPAGRPDTAGAAEDLPELGPCFLFQYHAEFAADVTEFLG